MAAEGWRNGRDFGMLEAEFLCSLHLVKIRGFTVGRGSEVARTPDISKAIESTVARAVRGEIAGELRRLERQVLKLTDRVKDLTVAASRSGRGLADPRVKRPVSPGRQLHGRYIGLLRHLPRRAQSQVRGVRKKQGVQAAIKAAERLRK